MARTTNGLHEGRTRQKGRPKHRASGTEGRRRAAADSIITDTGNVEPCLPLPPT